MRKKELKKLNDKLFAAVKENDVIRTEELLKKGADASFDNYRCFRKAFDLGCCDTLTRVLIKYETSYDNALIENLVLSGLLDRSYDRNSDITIASFVKMILTKFDMDYEFLYNGNLKKKIFMSAVSWPHKALQEVAGVLLDYIITNYYSHRGFYEEDDNFFKDIDKLLRYGGDVFENVAIYFNNIPNKIIPKICNTVEKYHKIDPFGKHFHVFEHELTVNCNSRLNYLLWMFEKSGRDSNRVQKAILEWFSNVELLKGNHWLMSADTGVLVLLGQWLLVTYDNDIKCFTDVKLTDFEIQKSCAMCRENQSWQNLPYRLHCLHQANSGNTEEAEVLADLDEF